MKHIFIFGFFLCALTTIGQSKSPFLGEWQYFDKDNKYFEITISQNYIFKYAEQLDLSKKSIKILNSTLTIQNESKWTLQEVDSNFLIVKSGGQTLILFRKSKHADTVKSIYSFLNQPNNGNGAMIFERGAQERRALLLETTKNNL